MFHMLHTPLESLFSFSNPFCIDVVVVVDDDDDDNDDVVVVVFICLKSGVRTCVRAYS